MDIQGITLGQISVAVLFIGGLIGGVKYLKSTLEDFLKKFLEKEFEQVNQTLRDMDVRSTKNFLIRYLSDIERGDTLYDAERQRFWEEYDHYVDDLKENSYIKEWVAKLKGEGKLTRLDNKESK